MKCIYCNHPYLYTLNDKQVKCSKCKRKFSPRKIQREQLLRKLFTDGVNVTKASQQTTMHFNTVKKHYEKFRRDLAIYADEMYQLNSHRMTEYDEYLYLPKTLSVKNNIGKLQHFLTMSYDNNIYNIMMPKANHSLRENKDEDSKKLLLKYLKFNKISKLATAQNNITKFWTYFEEFIVQYKGVSDEQFIFYLKEAEWRYNTKDALKHKIN